MRHTFDAEVELRSGMSPVFRRFVTRRGIRARSQGLRECVGCKDLSRGRQAFVRDNMVNRLCRVSWTSITCHG